MSETKPKRRWFRFSIRDIFWLTLVVGMALAWIASIHSTEERRENEYRAAISKIAELKSELSRMAGSNAALVRMLEGPRAPRLPAATEP